MVKQAVQGLPNHPIDVGLVSKFEKTMESVVDAWVLDELPEQVIDQYGNEHGRVLIFILESEDAYYEVFFGKGRKEDFLHASLVGGMEIMVPASGYWDLVERGCGNGFYGVTEKIIEDHYANIAELTETEPKAR